MPALPTFTDFLNATKAHKITGPREILTEAQKNTYFLRHMVKNASESGVKVVRGGSSIRDDVQFSTNGSFGFYGPNADTSAPDTDHNTTISVGWRFAKTSFGYNDETITLNSDAAPEDRFVDLKYSKFLQCKLEMWNGMETALWAVPTATMESGGGDTPPAYSIPFAVNEATNGIWPGLSTKASISATTESRWRPQQVAYNQGAPESETDGLIASFDLMWPAVQFESPDPSDADFEKNTRMMQRIATNKRGQALYKRMLRAANDQTRTGPQDPSYNKPEYSGIPVEYVSTLDTATLEITSQTTATGSAYPNTKPRFFWLSLKYIFPVYHSRGYMEQVGPRDGGLTKAFSHGVFFRTWYNLFWRSLQRQGIVYPNA